jgi:hypothetical protein
VRRRDRTCPRCHRVNIRYEGSLSLLANPYYEENCTWCGTDLVSGRRTLGDLTIAISFWLGFFTLMTVAASTPLLFAFVLFWPEHLDRSLLLRLTPFAFGLALGLGTVAYAWRYGAKRESPLPDATHD